MGEWQELMQRAAAGDTAARGELIAPCLSPLRAYLRLRAGTLVRAHESVSDLVQSVCREVIQDLHSVLLHDETALRKWVFRCAERKLVDRARRYRALRRGGAKPRDPLASWSEVDPEALAAYASFAGPVEAAMAAETQDRIERALRSLAADDRRVIVLSRVQGLPTGEVARLMRRSPNSVGVLLFRALARLAKRLADTALD